MAKFEVYPKHLDGVLAAYGLPTDGDEIKKRGLIRKHLKANPAALAMSGVGNVPPLVPRSDPDLDKVQHWLRLNHARISEASKLLALDDSAARNDTVERRLEQVIAALRLDASKIKVLQSWITGNGGALPKQLLSIDDPDLDRLRQWFDGHPKEIVNTLKRLGLKNDDCTAEKTHHVGRLRIQAHLRLHAEDRQKALAPLDAELRKVVRFDQRQLKASKAVTNGRGFYLEPQKNAQCAQHALNAFLGGPAVSLAQLNAFKTSAYGEEDLRHGSQAVIFDSVSGSAVTEPGNYLSLLHRLKLSEHRVRTKIIDPTGRLSDASGEPPKDVPGDRCIVYSQSSKSKIDPKDKSWKPQSAHFVAFRRDTDGNWWLLDSVQKAKGPIRKTPTQYMKEQLAQFPRQTMSIAMLNLAPADEDTTDEGEGEGDAGSDNPAPEGLGSGEGPEPPPSNDGRSDQPEEQSKTGEPLRERSDAPDVVPQETLTVAEVKQLAGSNTDIIG